MNTKEELLDHLETAWGIIANAYQGNWDTAHPDWRKAAERWREKWHKILDNRKPE